MKTKELNKLAEYLTRVDTLRESIERIKSDKNAPVDGARGVEGELERLQERNRDKLLEILVRDAVSREVERRQNQDDGR